MSVYIKGLEMPKDGELLCINIYPDGKVSINLDLKCERIATAVPVPPHGRLIDADALANKHRTMAYEDGGRKYSFHTTAKSWVEGAPTIIPSSKEDE